MERKRYKTGNRWKYNRFCDDSTLKSTCELGDAAAFLGALIGEGSEENELDEFVETYEGGQEHEENANRAPTESWDKQNWNLNQLFNVTF